MMEIKTNNLLKRHRSSRLEFTRQQQNVHLQTKQKLAMTMISNLKQIYYYLITLFSISYYYYR